MAGRDISNEQMRRLQSMLGTLEQGSLLDGLANTEEEKPDYVADLYEPQQEVIPQNQFIMEDDRGMLDTTSSFSNHYGGAPAQFTATEQERYNSNHPPGGDYANWQWAGNYGWIYKGNAEDGTAGKSSFINDQGQRVHHDPVRSLERDTEWWDSKRATIGLSEAWASGGDQFLREGGLYNESTNPYVETPEMRQAAQAGLMNSPSGGGVYDPVTNTTAWGGMHYQGDMTQGKHISEFTPQEQQYLTHDRYYTGMDQLTPEGYGYISEALGRTGNGNPFINTFDWDVDRSLRYLGDSDYNPFYQNKGWIHQDMIDRNRELGRQGDELTDYEKRKEGNIADYMYNAFKDPSMIKHRGTALRNWDQWKDEKKINESSLYSRRMNQSTFNQLGLGEMGLTFDQGYNQQFGGRSAMPSTNPLTSGGNASGSSAMFGGQPIEVKEGGFLDAYMKRREQTRPDVMSLMNEIKDS